MRRNNTKAGVFNAIKESWIKAEILEYLKSQDIFHWVHQAGKIPGRRLIKVGIADIIGVLPGGRTLAIEVKTAKGRLTPEQHKFITEVNANGGLAFVARSLDDVKSRLTVPNPRIENQPKRGE